MRRRLTIAAAVTASVLVCSTVALAVRPDLRHQLRDHFPSGGIGAPEETSPLPPIPTATPLPVRIAAAGDVGTGDAVALRTAAAMDELEAVSEYDALLLLGDNVYPNGDPESDRTELRAVDQAGRLVDSVTLTP